MFIFFNLLLSYIAFFWHQLGNFKFLFIAISISFTLKCCILIPLLFLYFKRKKAQASFYFLILILVSALPPDIAWLTKLSKSLFFPNLNFKVGLFIFRIAWGFTMIKYQALGFFIESLSSKKYKFSWFQWLLFFTSSIITLFFITLAFICFSTPYSRPAIEFIIFKLATFYTSFIAILPSISIVLYKIRKENIPTILKKQLLIITLYVITPFLITGLIQLYPFNFYLRDHSYSVVGISTIMLTFCIYYCAKKIMGLRFLNFKKHVQPTTEFNFIDDFKTVLEQFSAVTNIKELRHITQTFFKDAFFIPHRRIHLYVRPANTQNNIDTNHYFNEEKITEHFLSLHSTKTIVGTFLKKSKIIISDEIEFSNFYEENSTQSIIIKFMQALNADIFIPIYNEEKVVAYIIIEKNARNNEYEFYTKTERDQMVVFVTYLGNIINLLQNRNIDMLMAQEKELREELYEKHKEINQYKESLRSFLNSEAQRKIGIIFYKNRKFSFGNKSAQDFLPINLNLQAGHPARKQLKRVVDHIQNYKTSYTDFTQDSKGNTLIIAGIPNKEQNNIIITLYYPEVSDILRQKIDLLKDPRKIDYILYLETTKSGKLINKLIPGNGKTLLNFKIDLLKIALSKKAILLDVLQDDIDNLVEIIHHISLRETLHVIEIKENTDQVKLAQTLFGINPLFAMQPTSIALLEKLDNTGTLFIKNIHLLNKELQQELAHFIKLGSYKVFKSDIKRSSNVRIICSTNKNLKSLVEKDIFSKRLFNELKKAFLHMPTLLHVPEEEIEELTVGFTKQTLKTNTFQNFLELTDKEKNKIVLSRPTSFKELKTRVKKILIKKSEKNYIDPENTLNQTYDVVDPLLKKAIELGKHALKDPKIMEALWNKFKNQNKIANLLGVNRSTINRRCKEYNLN